MMKKFNIILFYQNFTNLEKTWQIQFKEFCELLLSFTELP